VCAIYPGLRAWEILCLALENCSSHEIDLKNNLRNDTLLDRYIHICDIYSRTSRLSWFLSPAVRHKLTFMCWRAIKQPYEQTNPILPSHQVQLYFFKHFLTVYFTQVAKYFYGIFFVSIVAFCLFGVCEVITCIGSLWDTSSLELNHCEIDMHFHYLITALVLLFDQQCVIHHWLG
jgi:hypothetical protein